jgi:glycerophosphoryl diester phosphodiesterase
VGATINYRNIELKNQYSASKLHEIKLLTLRVYKNGSYALICIKLNLLLMRNLIVLISIVVLVIGCAPEKQILKEIDWQGHRGARGNFPENTWPAFQYAMDQKMTTLEMDVVITADSQVVVSHEPFMNHLICLDPDGNDIVEEEEKQYNIFHMSYEELQGFDCGTRIHPSFLKQTHVSVSKPLLSMVLNKVKLYAKMQKISLPRLNVEVKYKAENEGEFHPDIATYSQLVFQVLEENYPMDKWNIQSFNFDVLKYWHEIYPEVKLAVLVENNTDWQAHIDYLGFTPEAYSPNHILLEGNTISDLQEAGMKVIPWTVNKPKVAERLIEQGVDGIITDYPIIASEIHNNQ